MIRRGCPAGTNAGTPDPLTTVFAYLLKGVRDKFMINYASGGIGTEILSNRLGVGPMHDCLNCAYEEFFLTHFTVGEIGNRWTSRPMPAWKPSPRRT